MKIYKRPVQSTILATGYWSSFMRNILFLAFTTRHYKTGVEKVQKTFITEVEQQWWITLFRRHVAFDIFTSLSGFILERKTPQLLQKHIDGIEEFSKEIKERTKNRTESMKACDLPKQFTGFKFNIHDINDFATFNIFSDLHELRN